MSDTSEPLEPWEREFKHEQKALLDRAGPFQVDDVAKILRPLTTQIQEIEDVFWTIFDQRFIENASGFSLAILGAILGEDQLDETEDIFKLRLSLKLRAINSNKKGKDFIELLEILAGRTWSVLDAKGVAVVIQKSGPTVDPQTLLRYLDIASADGVLCRLETPFTETAEDTFLWPSKDGAVAGSEWGSKDGAIVGDNWFSRVITT